MTNKTIFQLGYPGGMGGANTECWHTVRLWRRMGLDVTLIPTWGRDPAWEAKLDAVGVKTLHVGDAARLREVEGLAGSIVVGMCNQHFCGAYPILREMQCRTVWVNCMTFMFSHEDYAWTKYGPPDCHVFQSEFQKACLEPMLRRAGSTDENFAVIRGALEIDDFPFNPRPAGAEFVIGRLARPDVDKWSSNHWNILDKVPHPGRRGLAMGWNQVLSRKCGAPPAWAEGLPPQSISAIEFYARCHAMVGLNGGARENWPRVGLEAMASGVPLVVQADWGWREMIRHGETGFLAGADAEFVEFLGILANQPETRENVIRNARAAVQELASPETLGAKWKAVFERLWK